VKRSRSQPARTRAFPFRRSRAKRSASTCHAHPSTSTATRAAGNARSIRVPNGCPRSQPVRAASLSSRTRSGLEDGQGPFGEPDVAQSDLVRRRDVPPANGDVRLCPWVVPARHGHLDDGGRPVEHSVRVRGGRPGHEGPVPGPQPRRPDAGLVRQAMAGGRVVAGGQALPFAVGHPAAHPCVRRHCLRPPGRAARHRPGGAEASRDPHRKDHRAARRAGPFPETRASDRGVRHNPAVGDRDVPRTVIRRPCSASPADVTWASGPTWPSPPSRSP
jgi:hypothetical protein